MGDLPPATTTTPPSAAAPEPPGPGSSAAAPRCRRVHFPDSVASPIWFPPAADNDDAMADEEEAEPVSSSSGPEKETGGELLEEEEDDRMDLLWEDFNEELQATRRAGGVSCSSEYSSSDGDSDSAAGRAPLHAGCFPVLRPAARAGGAGLHYRRRAGTWVLLVRIFRSLFVVDKTTVPSARHRHATSSAR